MSDPRNLIIGFDGTWNEPQLNNGKAVDTNVVKFLNALKSLNGRQRTHYQNGVGSRAWEALPGGVYGYGLEKRVQGAYRFLCNRLADDKWPADQNRVFVIGFSRGAYSARRFAGLVNFCGVPVDPEDTELGWEVFNRQDAATAEAMLESGRFVATPIEVVGVWDTVKATNDADFHDDVLPANVKAGYHAMSIDERRSFFQILRWDNDPRVLQLWFAGVHSDIGGGYTQQGLSDIALNWMIFRLLDHGLAFKKEYVDDNVKPRPTGAQHDSYKGIWKPLGTATRKVLAADFVHESVGERLEKKPDYRPDNLPAKPRYWSPPA